LFLTVKLAQKSAGFFAGDYFLQKKANVKINFCPASAERKEGNESANKDSTLIGNVLH
jgi:hypothetical protein